MGGAAAISSICDGANPLSWLIVRVGTLGTFAGLIVLGAAVIALAVWNRARILREASELHESAAKARSNA